jgi:hypothetical protein
MTSHEYLSCGNCGSSFVRGSQGSQAEEEYDRVCQRWLCEYLCASCVSEDNNEED